MEIGLLQKKGCVYDEEDRFGIGDTGEYFREQGSSWSCAGGK